MLRNTIKQLFREGGWWQILVFSVVIFFHRIFLNPAESIQEFIMKLLDENKAKVVVDFLKEPVVIQGINVVDSLILGVLLIVFAHIIAYLLGERLSGGKTTGYRDDHISIKMKVFWENITITNNIFLYNYFKELDLRTITQCSDIADNKIIEIDPPVIYDHIINSSKLFESSVISVDLDIDAWYYACDPEDFTFVANHFDEVNRGEDKRQVEDSKDKFERNYKSRRRVDPTYEIYKNMLDRANKISGANPVRRLIVLRKSVKHLTPKEWIILAFLRRVKKITRGKIYNKYIISLPEHDADECGYNKPLDELQDIILFDDKIAYKEYLGNFDGNCKSEIIIKPELIKEYRVKFDKLFDSGKEISEIFK
jgi:hypothetical protein